MTERSPHAEFDVFLSYNSKDEKRVAQIAEKLREHDVKPWFAPWEIAPGEPFVPQIEKGLNRSATTAVFIGRSGRGPWQDRETQTALDIQARNPNARVIPVILPGVSPPKALHGATILSGNRWVSFAVLDDPIAITELVAGITGKRERLRIDPEELRRVTEKWKRASRRRQLLLLAVAIVGLAAFFVLHNVSGGRFRSQASSLEATLLKPNTAVVQEGRRDYESVLLEADLQRLTDAERMMLKHLIDASQPIDEVFWIQAYGDRQQLISRIDDEALRRLVEINYGPWNRLDNNTSLISRIDAKPTGANFYPPEVEKPRIVHDAASIPLLLDPYTMVRIDAAGGLLAIKYSQFFEEHFKVSAQHLNRASGLAKDPALRKYLAARATAFMSDDYEMSELAWMGTAESNIDVIIGPIETYEDELLGLKRAAEAIVLVKDWQASAVVSQYKSKLQYLQDRIPIPREYRLDVVGQSSALGVYDAVYCSGGCNAGSKTVGVNLPNDPAFAQAVGTRRLILGNVLRAKFSKIVSPIAEMLIDPLQRPNVTVEAYFDNVLFHEVAHGLMVRTAKGDGHPTGVSLGNYASLVEEAKADALGLFAVRQLHAEGMLKEDLLDYYATFLASMLRSVRLGGSSVHAKANLMRLNYLMDRGAVVRDNSTRTYGVDVELMKQAVDSLAQALLFIQARADVLEVERLLKQYGAEGSDLSGDLDRLSQAGVPIDLVYEQGWSVLVRSNAIPHCRLP